MLCYAMPGTPVVATVTGSQGKKKKEQKVRHEKEEEKEVNFFLPSFLL